jgi:hypothetical protein
VPGATGASYTPVAGDQGKVPSVVVTATNLAGAPVNIFNVVASTALRRALRTSTEYCICCSR